MIFGDGKQTRDFVFVKDVVRANILAAESSYAGILNIGNVESVNLNQLTRLISKIMGKNGLQPEYQPERQGDIKHSRADITRAGSIGYLPKYSLEEGLGETIPASGTGKE